MRILGAIVFPGTEIMLLRQAEIAQRSTVRWQFVGDEGIRDEALFLQQFAHRFQRRLLVSPALNQDIQNFAVDVDSAPQMHLLAVDRDKDLVQVPATVWSRAQTAQPVGIGRSELQGSAADRFIGDLDTPLREQVLDVPDSSEETGNTA